MSSDHSKKAKSKLVGLHPAVPASCRAALREVMSDSGKPRVPAGSTAELPATELPEAGHIEACGFCSARVKARASLAKWASARPAVPTALASPSVLEGIYELATEAVEYGPIGEWLEQAAVSVADSAATEVAAASGIGSSFLQDCLSENSAPNELLGDLVRSPVQPDPQVWNGVCRSILEGVASERVVRRQAGWRFLLAGAAAVAVVGLLSIQEGTPALTTIAQPTITFADLDRAPDVAFANVRYGSRY